MTSRARPSFWRSYDGLPDRVKAATRRAYRLFGQDPGHPSLNFKKLQRYEHVWSVRINEQHRAVGEREGDVIEWAWIGSHNEFDSRFG